VLSSPRQEFLVNGKFGIADAYAYIVAGWHKYVGVTLDAYPNVAAFVARVAELPSVKSAHALMATAPTHTV
jgi:glutathione S-transferase